VRTPATVPPGKHWIVADLGYGDAGKGGVVDWLCSRPENRVHTVVRYNGGAQAAHNVVTSDGRWHTFAQFGSGTLQSVTRTSGTRTFLSRYMMVDPLAMAGEAAHLSALGLASPFGLVAVDQDALLTTPYHQAANRAREQARGEGRHGSCGMGIGETAAYAVARPADAPRAGDCLTAITLLGKLTLLRDWLLDESGLVGVAEIPPPSAVADAYAAWADRVTITRDGYLASLLRQPGSVVFEGAQGVLLDEWRGFHPYTTWSTTTFENAETLLREAGTSGEAGMAGVRVGVTRAYQTRHGPGPFVTADPTLELPEPHNRVGQWQGPVRVGHLDAVALRYAIEACGGIDAVALTHLDTAREHAGKLRICRAYRVGERGLADRLVPGPHRDLAYQERLTSMLLAARPVYGGAPGSDGDWCDAVAEITGAPVALRSYGPASAAKAGNLQAASAAISR
jgi:adenylosuccinate synthase